MLSGFGLGGTASAVSYFNSPSTPANIPSPNVKTGPAQDYSLSKLGVRRGTANPIMGKATGNVGYTTPVFLDDAPDYMKPRNAVKPAGETGSYAFSAKAASAPFAPPAGSSAASWQVVGASTITRLRKLENGKTLIHADTVKIDSDGNVVSDYPWMKPYSLKEAQNLTSSTSVVNGAGMGFQDFINESLASKGNTNYYIGKVPDATASMIGGKVGVNVSDFNVMIRSGDIRHIFNAHSKDAQREALRGQIPITPELLAQLPEVFNKPDTVVKLDSKDYGGRTAFEISKRINGYAISVVAVGEGRHNLNIDSYRVINKKRPAASFDDGTRPQSSTSKTGSNQAFNHYKKTSKNVNGNKGRNRTKLIITENNGTIPQNVGMEPRMPGEPQQTLIMRTENGPFVYKVKGGQSQFRQATGQAGVLDNGGAGTGLRSGGEDFVGQMAGEAKPVIEDIYDTTKTESQKSISTPKYNKERLLTDNNNRSFEERLLSYSHKHGIMKEDYDIFRRKNAGELTESQRASMAAIREEKLFPNETTILERVITYYDTLMYIRGNYRPVVKGFVLEAIDSKNYHSYMDYYNGLRLDYDGSKYRPYKDNSLYVVRFRTKDTDLLRIPFSKEMKGLFNESTGMIFEYEQPFTGMGITKALDGCPEYKSLDSIRIEDGAEIFEIT